MTQRPTIGFRVHALASFLIIIVGCTSSLHIDVAVYKGPVTGNRRARLDSALGLARANWGVATRIKRNKRQELVADITKQYAELRIWEAIDIAPPATDYAAARAWEDSTASKLRAYNKNCQSVVRGLGYAEIAKTKLLHLLWIPDDDIDYLAALINIDENTRLIDDLLGAARPDDMLEGNGQTGKDVKAADAAAKPRKKNAKNVEDDEVFLRDIASIMDSQSPGALMLAVREAVPFWHRHKIDRIYNGVYWSEINPIEATGMGDYMAMLVKDDIGNWHLKKVEVDPEEIIKTAAKLAELALKAAAP